MSLRSTSRPAIPDPQSTAALLKRCCPVRPTLAVVLGSGFHGAIRRMKLTKELAYSALPGFPAVGVEGHAGRVLLGHLAATPLLVLDGRAHFYEGHSLSAVTFPVRVLAAFGIRDLLLTNAAGGIQRRLRPGGFMRVKDHINCMGANPLRGVAMKGCERFVDLSRVYDSRLNNLLSRAAAKIKLRLPAGVYLAVSGPSYETPAEIRAFARLGADAVGMSTVPEAIVARQCGISVAALSCITNRATGLGKGLLRHAEVLTTGERAQKEAAALLESFAEIYAGKK